MRQHPFSISPKIKAKLKQKHNVSLQEVAQCFYNRSHGTLIANREAHKTQPPIQWFIAKSDKGRILKVIFVLENGKVYIKSCFDADKASQRIYERLAK